MMAENDPPSPTGWTATETGDLLADRLGRQGGSAAERQMRRVVPWLISLGLHGSFIAVGFLITWSVVHLQAEREPTLIVSDFYASQYQPVVSQGLSEEAAAEPVHDKPLATQPVESTSATDRRGADLDPLTAVYDRTGAANLGQSGGARLGDFAPRVEAGSATFIGVRSSNVRRVVYVIDASGSMIRSLPIVLEELARSLEGLTAAQSFGIIFFQNNEAVVVPPGDRLTPARPKDRTAALEWIERNVIPGGRSNPIAALEAAMRLEPEVIFLLSENITGLGEFEIDQRDLLALLERLNPIVGDSGRRGTQINCLEFLSRDPLDTLKKIAEAHGGPNGYRFLSREALGIAGP
jgi:hypothetical protein